MTYKETTHIELIDPISWGCDPLSGEMCAQFAAVSDDYKDNYSSDVIITMPLHEDFYDFCKEYCRQYKIHIQNKLDDES